MEKLFKRYSHFSLLLLIWFILCLLIISRRPDMLLNAQPWAEDGKILISEAIFNGWQSLIFLYAGYLNLIPKLITSIIIGISLAFNQGITLVPLLMNLSAISISACCCIFICSKRFSWLAPLPFRMITTFLIVLLPGSGEIYGNITNVQWWIGYFQLLVTWDILVNNRIPTGICFVVIVIASFSGPLGIFPLLGCCILFFRSWFKNGFNKNILSILKATGVIGAGSVLQIIMILIYRNSPGSFDILLFIVNFPRLLFGGVFARLITLQFANSVNMLHFWCIVILGIIFLLFLFIIFNKIKSFFIIPLCFVVLIMLMVSIEVPVMLKVYKEPFYDLGTRYFFLPIAIVITMVVSALGMNWGELSRIKLSLMSILLAVITFTMLVNFSIPPFADKHWKYYVRCFNLNSNRVCEIPINPEGWEMRIPCK